MSKPKRRRCSVVLVRLVKLVGPCSASVSPASCVYIWVAGATRTTERRNYIEISVPVSTYNYVPNIIILEPCSVN
ncbi:hypothetical protein PF005_g20416 [Phytophthora fragariae]|uniref:Secreted protein n=1 Tax=Phytophthora fragariae TaxID=53985 RepID=A0A6A3WLV3_9STRA|nr:hypothetical protein PF003_g13954 [Phytophthora fragariae]KAE8928402.1 hypothetical protein PF009_g21459 [Phytophthora fragariae]KAE8961031.1 hypothetical protein PF011_g29898 [Phytophthora fragariae]KAE9087118.1 hypothetical protein PF007_g20501 [Phytophthora fragariae]KAE9087764.1 hypothetical protein PF010_g19610 [Phytophthora fragariae]